MRVLAQTYGFNIRAHVLLDDAQEPVGGIPFCHFKDLKDQRCVTLPFSDYCDPLVANFEQWPGHNGSMSTGKCLEERIIVASLE